MIGRVWAMALNTFREAVRDRVLYLLLVVGLGAVAFSKFLGEISVGAALLKNINTGLTAVSLLGVMTIVTGGSVIVVSRPLESYVSYQVLVSRRVIVFRRLSESYVKTSHVSVTVACGLFTFQRQSFPS